MLVFIAWAGTFYVGLFVMLQRGLLAKIEGFYWKNISINTPVNTRYIGVYILNKIKHPLKSTKYVSTLYVTRTLNVYADVYTKYWRLCCTCCQGDQHAYSFQLVVLLVYGQYNVIRTTSWFYPMLFIVNIVLCTIHTIYVHLYYIVNTYITTSSSL